MSNVTPLCRQRVKPDRISRIGSRMSRDWSIQQFDTQPLPTFDALLAGPVSEMDAVPQPLPAGYVHVDRVMEIAAGSFLLGGAVVLGMFWAMLR